MRPIYTTPSIAFFCDMSKWIKPDDYVEKKYNYTYKLTLKSDPRYYYYGVHSSNIEPEFDDYEGSGTNIKKLIKEKGHGIFEREILDFYDTREESLEAEEALVTEEVILDPFCLNRVKGGGTLDTSGIRYDEETRKKMGKHSLGTKRKPESIEKMIYTKRARGTDKHNEETKKKLSEIRKGKIPVKKGNIEKRIKREELNDYLSSGWETGHTETRNKKISISKMGEKNPMFGKHWTEEQKEKMLNTKYKHGTNLHSKETKEKLAKLNKEKAKDPEFLKKLSNSLKGKNIWSKGRKFINKNGIMKSVLPEEVQIYLDEGWIIGRIKQ